jgi:dTDP-4-amino-4,6-dideoxygalactose transaminase
MKQCGVDTGIHWQAGHSFSFLKNCRRGSLEATNRVVEQILSLPLHSKMCKSDIDRVIKSIASFPPNP